MRATDSGDGHHHQSTSQWPSNLQRCALGSPTAGSVLLAHEERVASHFSADAAERSEQPAGVDWVTHGAECPK